MGNIIESVVECGSVYYVVLFSFTQPFDLYRLTYTKVYVKYATHW